MIEKTVEGTRAALTDQVPFPGEMERDDARGSIGLVVVGHSIEVRRHPRERAGADVLLGEVATVAGFDQRTSRRAISEVARRNVGVDHRSQSILEQATAA